MSAEIPKLDSEALINAMMGTIRHFFYKTRPEKEWWQDQRMLKKVVTWPAVWAEQRGIKLTAEQIERILKTVFRTALDNGALGDVVRMAPYLQSCVESHLRIQGEVYYDAVKGIRDVGPVAKQALKAMQADLREDATTPMLAEVYRIVAKAVRGGRKKAAPPAQQGDLFSQTSVQQGKSG